MWPTHRHDNTEFTERDINRKDRAGTSLGVCGIVLDCTGDWMEFAARYGLPTWTSTDSPCPFCDITKTMLCHHRIPRDWTLHAQDRYNEECRRCEHFVVVSDADQHRDIRFRLKYAVKYRGRGLTESLPTLGLEVGDKLVPTPQLRDVGLFDLIKVFPVIVCFWRQSCSSRTYW